MTWWGKRVIRLEGQVTGSSSRRLTRTPSHTPIGSYIVPCTIHDVDPVLAFMVIEYIYNSDEWTQGSREGFDWVGGLESQYKRGQTRRCTRLEHTRVAGN